MQTIPLEQAEGHLAEIVEKLSLGEEVVTTSPTGTERRTWHARNRVLVRGC
jgi:hypothetical protein